MRIFNKKVPSGKISLLRGAVNCRRELESIIYSLEDDLTEVKDKSQHPSFYDTGRMVAQYDIPMIDLIPRLNDNNFLSSYAKSFVPHVKRYIELLKKGKHNEALQLNRNYWKSNQFYE